jgi:hypothetical protein
MTSWPDITSASMRANAAGLPRQGYRRLNRDRYIRRSKTILIIKKTCNILAQFYLSVDERRNVLF